MITIIVYILYYITASFHNFKSQNLKLRVSNPENKYVVCLSVLSQISNCQGLGRNNKFEILKTDRNNQRQDSRVDSSCSGSVLDLQEALDVISQYI